MKKLPALFLTIAVCLSVSFACNRTPDAPDPASGEIPFPKPAEQIDRVPLTRAEEAFVQAGNDFAWRLTRKVWAQVQGGKGIILSPLSVQYALGMLGNGAGPDVAARLAAVLGYEGTSAINAFCAKLIECLPAVDTSVTLALANGVLVKDGYPLKPAFRSAVETSYGALVHSMPFTDAAAVMKYVNDWCNRHTYGRIPEVLKEVDAQAFLYLMNAIYFNGKWSEPFEKADTRNEDFRTPSKGTVKVGMMHKTLEALYAENEGCQSLRIPYGNGRYAFNVYLPKGNGSPAALLDDPATGLPRPAEICRVILSIPGFKTDYEIELKTLLAGMGLPLGPYDELVENASAPEISKVIHKATITVDESGSEAAAVTVVEMRETAVAPGAGPRTVTFTADHPFLYTITEATSGVILFTGVYTGE